MGVTSNHLTISIPENNSFYSLYSDGLLLRKTYVRHLESTLIEYDDNAVVALYYSYPTHREACLIRNVSLPSSVSLPGLSRNVSLLFSVHASRVDKLKRAIGFLNTHTKKNAFSFNDGFYIRLLFLLRQKGKLNYQSLRFLTEKY